MNWYYVDAGQQAGPVNDTELAELERSGKLQLDTLVWHEGMTSWQPYHYVKPGGSPAATPVMAPPPPSTSAGQGVCAECGGVFNLDDMIPYGNIRVCARCKPILMQKLAEGAQLNTGVMTYAGFWTRFAAVFLDGIILWVLNTAINVAAGLGAFQTARNPSNPFSIVFFLVLALQVAIALSYETVMIGKFGATLGKMACKIKVVTAEGGQVTYLRALGRYFAKLLSSLICGIGYLMAGFDDEKRALHDRICNTRVILK